LARLTEHQKKRREQLAQDEIAMGKIRGLNLDDKAVTS